MSPLIVYLLVSGKVTEFEGLGWRAKFRQISIESVGKTALASELVVSSQEASKPDFYKEAYWGFCRPYYVLSDKTARSADGSLDKKTAVQIAIAIRSSMICGQFTALIVVNDNQNPVGLFLPSQFSEILQVPLVTYGTNTTLNFDEAYSQVAASELGVVLANPIIRAQSEEGQHVAIRWDATIQTAYSVMLAKGTTVAMITDRLGRFDGIITRSVIEGRVIETLLAASK